MVASAKLRTAQSADRTLPPLCREVLRHAWRPGRRSRSVDSSPAGGSRGDQHHGNFGDHLRPRTLRQLQHQHQRTGQEGSPRPSSGRRQDREDVLSRQEGRDFFRKTDYEVVTALDWRDELLRLQPGQRVGNLLMKDYLEKQLDEVVMVFGEFVSMGQQPPRDLNILPMAMRSPGRPRRRGQGGRGGRSGGSKEYIYEPSVEAFWPNCCRGSSRSRSTAACWTPPPASTQPHDGHGQCHELATT